MIRNALAYTFLAGLLSLATMYLYTKVLRLKAESFGLGLSYVLPAVTCLGLATVSGAMALLEFAASKVSPILALTTSRSEPGNVKCYKLGVE